MQFPRDETSLGECRFGECSFRKFTILLHIITFQPINITHKPVVNNHFMGLGKCFSRMDFYEAEQSYINF